MSTAKIIILPTVDIDRRLLGLMSHVGSCGYTAVARYGVNKGTLKNKLKNWLKKN